MFYRYYYSMILDLIINNSGSEEDAEDIFQEVIILIYKKSKKETIHLSASLRTYIFAVCKNIWLKQLRINQNKSCLETHNKMCEQEHVYQGTVDAEEELYREILYRKHFFRLSDQCQKILLLFFKKTPLKEIARILGYKSEGYIKKAKHKCKEQLINSIKNDPKYKMFKT